MEGVNPVQLASLIFTVRGQQVMMDHDLAVLYQVETKVLNQSVKRNMDRFPDTFRFQLSEEEHKSLQPIEVTFEQRPKSLRSQFVTLESRKGKHRKYRPHVFTEQGVAMLSAVLHSDFAIQVSIQIMQAFVQLRKSFVQLHGVIQRLEGVEMRQLQTDHKLEAVFKALEKNIAPKQGIFFEGQLFDAHVFASNRIKEAAKSILLVDNFVDETTLLLLSKRRKGVTCQVHTRLKPALLKDLEKHHQQYEPITLVDNRSSHDRFLILDHTRLYHFGASLKDLGRKCFAFSRMDNLLAALEEKLLNPKNHE